MTAKKTTPKKAPEKNAPAKKSSRAVPWAELVRESEAMRAKAHAPYSNYTVGAALWAARPGEAPRLYRGANVENASYGLCTCAERNAIYAAVLDGARDFRALAVATKGPKPGAPCGMCRQVLAEFTLDVPIALVVNGVEKDRTTLKLLLPRAFRGAYL